MSVRSLRLTVSTYVGEGIEQTCTVRDLTEHDFTATQLAALEHILVRAGQNPAPPAATYKGENPAAVAAVTIPGDRVTAMRALARQANYTGDSCDNCGAFTIKRTGKCTTCDNCGATGGCG